MATLIQPYSLVEAVAQILELIEKRRVLQSSATLVFLGISGIDCSGKSTLAHALAREAEADGLRVELVAVDDFIIPKATRKSEGSPHIDYFNHTFDHAAFAALTRQAADELKPHLVIGEGVFLFRHELTDTWDLKVWIEMSTEKSLERGSVRDAEQFGSRKAAHSEYLRSFIPAHQYHMLRDRPSEQVDLLLEVP